MANPQKENGFTPIANEVIEALVKSHLLGSEFSMIMFVIRKTWGFQKKVDTISYSQFQKELKLSRVTVSKTIKNLVSKNILVKTCILPSKISFSFNKDYEKWLVNTPILVKGKWQTSKDMYTETGIHGYTHKRKKEITKENSEVPSQSISTIINSFKEVNTAYVKWFGNKTQRGACERLLEQHNFEQILKVIELLSRTNNMPYMPKITTPLQLEDKWASLEAQLKSKKAETLSKKVNIII